MAKFSPPFAHDGERRSTTSDEQEYGIPCGPFDRPMWHGLFHNVQAELGNLIAASGQTDSEGDLEQVAKAVQSGKVNYAIASGTANALTVTLVPAPTALTPGMMVHVKVGAANTGPATLNVNGLGVREIIYNDTGEKLVGKDFAAGETLNLLFDGTNWRVHLTLGFLDRRYSKLSAPPSNDFYVVGSTGKDTNSGLAPTPEDGFKTIQGAIDAICNNYLTVGTVTIHVEDGTYDGFSIYPSFISSWSIKGNDSFPDRVKINSTSLSTNAGRGYVNYGAFTTISGIEFFSYYENISHSGPGKTSIINCNINMPYAICSAILCYGGDIFMHGKFNISGNGNVFIYAAGGASIGIGYQDELNSYAASFNYKNAVFNGANIAASRNGEVTIASNIFFQTGIAAGKRYYADGNGVICVNGAGVNFIAGTISGTLATGGQYF